MANKNLVDGLSNLSVDKQLLFGACCMERIIHLYKYFEEELSSEKDQYFDKYKDGYTYLKTLLDNIFETIYQNRSKNDDYKLIEEKCTELAPDTEEVSSDNAVLAQNCALGLSYIYAFLSDNQLENIIYCSEKTVESIDVIGFSQNRDEEQIDQIIKFEAEKQNECIQKLHDLPEYLNEIDIKTLRDWNKENLIDFKVK